jgi:tetratricopeptide (TPR) repeat protein
MLPEIGKCFNDAPCGCMIKFGDAMNMFGSDAAAHTADPHELLKLCRDFTLQSQKYHEIPELIITDASIESVLVHVAALGCSVLQARVDALPATAVKVEKTAADSLSRATLLEDHNFIARDLELALVGSVVEAVFLSDAPASREILLLWGHPGTGKTAAARRGLSLIQNRYIAASCCKDVHVRSIIRGRGAAAVQEDLVRWGRDIGSAIGVGSGAPPETVLPLLKEFLQQGRYVVLIDDADEAGLQEALKHLPPSQMQCALLITSQVLQQKDVQAYVTAAEAGVAVLSIISVCELQPLSTCECMELMQKLFLHPPSNPSDKPFISFAPLYAHEAELCAAFEALVRLPLAIRFFGCWFRVKYQKEMQDARQKAVTLFDEAATGATVVKKMLAQWRETCAVVEVAAGAEHSRGLQGTVRLAIEFLKSTPRHARACPQLLAMLALCPPVQTPWTLFDGGGAAQAAMMTQGRRVVVNGQSVCYASVIGESCRILKLKLEAVAVSDEVKEGGKVTVRSSDGKVIHVRGSDLLFEGDAKAEESDGRWVFRSAASAQSRHQEGRILRQHDDGSVSVMFQGPHQGCHVQLQGLVDRSDLNGCFGYVCGACDSATQRWPVRVTLPSNNTKDMSLKADNLIRTGKVMVRDGDGCLCAVPAFASGWLTVHRPGSEVLRFRREDVQGVRPKDVLPDVMHALGDIAAALGSLGLVDLNQAGRMFGMNQLIQRIVRVELGDVHDTALTSLLEARFGCMGDENHFDHVDFMIKREILGVAGHIVEQMKAAAPRHVEWACAMRVRLTQVARAVIGKSFELDSYLDALNADWSALVADQPPAAALRAIDWYRKGAQARNNELADQALIAQIQEAISMAPDTSAVWDCRVSLAWAQYTAACGLSQRGQNFGNRDRAIELLERALRIQIVTLGENHAETAQTIVRIGLTFGEKGQHDRAIDLCERALRIQMVCLGENHVETAGTLFNMGVQYSSIGQFHTSIDFFQRAFLIQTAAFGDLHHSTAQTILSMGAAYGKMGQFDRSVELFERALRILMAILGEMHADTAGAILSLGTAYGNLAQLDRAIELFERALRIQIATVGEMHASTAATISSMGALYGRKGQHDQAIAETERALRIFNAVLGPHHPQTQQTARDVSDAARKQQFFLRRLEGTKKSGA